MLFGSVCSGIEAASVAWHPLGWRAAWLAEIDKFASAVLAHHYPGVPNLGDMTKIARAILAGEAPAPDVLCGGTPCQAFSVAGLRNSLDDARGNLTLKFVEIANAIDHVRVRRGEDECIVFWENVPGVLNTKDNAFGCFLAGLAGEDEPLQPPWQKWTNAGAVYGPRRAVAWRTLDAQYFGVAQRRRRVFVVASARKGFDPATVLFEWDGLRRDTPPSREAREGTARGVEIGPGGGRFTDLNPTLDTRAKDGPIRNQLAGAVLQQTPSVQVCPTLRAGGNQTGGDRPPGTDVDTADSLIPVTTHTLRGEGFDASEDGTGRGTPLVPVAAYSFAENSRHELRLEAGDGSRTGALSTGGGKPGQGVPCVAIAFPANLSATQHASTENLSQALGAKNPTAVAFQERGRTEGRSLEVGGDIAYALTAPNGGGRAQERNVLTPTMQVRRLTPTEAERLMGFPDGYTAIPWRGKPPEQCPDGPRYRALGNSWAVPNAAWIGRRIDAAVRKLAP